MSLFNYLLGKEMNMGSEQTFVISNKFGLDLTISLKVMTTKITNWIVPPDISCSDHRYVQFEIEIGTREVQTNPIKFIFEISILRHQ